MPSIRTDPTAFTPAYRLVLALGGPVMRPWSRLEVRGLDALPADGPTLLVADHDSYWDPIAIGYAARHVRQVRALSKSTLWKTPVTAAFMNGMGHIPVQRGVNNDEALQVAAEHLRAGACIGMFPEGTRSLGRVLRARSGVGRLARAVPEAAVVCVRTTGTADVVRVPTRPRVTVEFYRPRGGPLQPDEDATAFAQRLLDELREAAPREIPGRRRTAARYRAALIPRGAPPGPLPGRDLGRSCAGTQDPPRSRTVRSGRALADLTDLAGPAGRPTRTGRPVRTSGRSLTGLTGRCRWSVHGRACGYIARTGSLAGARPGLVRRCSGRGRRSRPGGTGGSGAVLRGGVP